MRVAWAADCIERQSGSRLAPLAFDLKPAKAAVEALSDGRRRLRRATVGFHLERPRLCFRAISNRGDAVAVGSFPEITRHQGQGADPALLAELGGSDV